jgi:N-acetylmuramoyl-L-alanine amidase
MIFDWIDSLIKYFSQKPNKTEAATVSSNTNVTVTEIKPMVNIIQPLDLKSVNFDKSPNQSDRNDIVRAIVLHHTGPGSFKGIVNWLKDPNAKAAAHYVLGTAGELTQLVNTTKKAWHAGPSTWTIEGVKRYDLNNCTVGIEICNVGVLFEKNGKYYYEDGRGDPVEWKGVTPFKASITYPSGKILEGFAVPYPEVQIEKLIALCKGIIKTYPNIGKNDILTHFNISTPEGRKNDPFGLDISDIVNKIFS